MLQSFQNLFADPRHLILLVGAAWLGLTLAERRVRPGGISKDDLNNLVFYGLIAFILAGRLIYALQNYSAFSINPLNIFAITPTLFDPFGGLAAALIAAFAYGQRKGLQLWKALDALTPFFASMAIGLAASHLALGGLLGTPTSLPWGMNEQDAVRHPLELYEVLASILTPSLLWLFKPNPRPGMFFLSFAALTSLSQLFIQAFRADTFFIFGGLRLPQVAAWFALAACFILFEAALAPHKPKTG